MSGNPNGCGYGFAHGDWAQVAGAGRALALPDVNRQAQASTPVMLDRFHLAQASSGRQTGFHADADFRASGTLVSGFLNAVGNQ
jgi:hypothetical protein